MHILGALFCILMLSPLFSLGDTVGAWLYDRKYNR